MTVGAGTAAETTTRFVYQGKDVVAEYIDTDGDGTADRRRVYWILPELDQRIGFIDYDGSQARLYYFLCDPAGSVQRIVDEDGVVVAQYDYDAFGNIRWENSFESIPNRYTFQGREWDAHAAHYHYRFRTYIPEWGSFTGPDMNLALGVLGEPNGMGNYLFCNNNPVVWTDPEGLAPTTIVDAIWDPASGKVSGRFEGDYKGRYKNYNTPWMYSAPGAVRDAVPLNLADLGMHRTDLLVPGMPNGYIQYYGGDGLVSDLGAGVLNVGPLLANTALTVVDGLGQLGGLVDEACIYVTGADTSVLYMSALQTGCGEPYSYLSACFATGVPYVVAKTGYGMRAFTARCSLATQRLRQAKLDPATRETVTSPRPRQLHHFATNKSKAYTPRMEKVAGRYGLSLDGSWNKEVLEHLGRHPNMYHEFVEQGMTRAAQEAGADVSRFLQLYEQYVKQPVRMNPELLTKKGWQ